MRNRDERIPTIVAAPRSGRRGSRGPARIVLRAQPDACRTRASGPASGSAAGGAGHPATAGSAGCCAASAAAAASAARGGHRRPAARGDQSGSSASGGVLRVRQQRARRGRKGGRRGQRRHPGAEPAVGDCDRGTLRLAGGRPSTTSRSESGGRTPSGIISSTRGFPPIVCRPSATARSSLSCRARRRKPGPPIGGPISSSRANENKTSLDAWLVRGVARLTRGVQYRAHLDECSGGA